MPKIYFLNDTSGNHSGCDAVMEMINYYLEPYQVLYRHCTHWNDVNEEAFAKADTVIMNGEGTLHDNQPNAYKFLSLIHKAQHQGKRTAIFNASWFNMSEIWKPILDNLNYISVREPMSYINVQVLTKEPHLFLDLSLNERFCDNTTFEGVKVNMMLGETHPDTPYGFINSPYLPYERLTLYDMSFRDIVNQLKRTNLYITGQFHGVCAALLANCPFIPVPSNTPKIESLVKWGDSTNFSTLRKNILSKPKMEAKDFAEMLNV